jgi:hypothetical protein
VAPGAASLAGEGEVMLATAGSVTCAPLLTAAMSAVVAGGSDALTGACDGGACDGGVCDGLLRAAAFGIGGSAGATLRGPGRVLTGGGSTLLGVARGGAGFFVLLGLSPFIDRGAHLDEARRESITDCSAMGERQVKRRRSTPVLAARLPLWSVPRACNEAA